MNRYIVTLSFITILISACSAASLKEQEYYFNRPSSSDFYQIKINAQVYEFGNKKSTIFNSGYVKIASNAWVSRGSSLVATGVCGSNTRSKFMLQALKPLKSNEEYSLTCQGDNLVLQKSRS